MHCYLHIGVEKTGTTSIQKFLYLNRALLNQNGYQLTDSLSKPNNTGITVLSLSSLKNVGSDAIKKIVQTRRNDGEFKNIDDFLSKVPYEFLTKKSLESLIKAGAFDIIEKNRNK